MFSDVNPQYTPNKMINTSYVPCCKYPISHGILFAELPIFIERVFCICGYMGTDLWVHDLWVHGYMYPLACKTSNVFYYYWVKFFNLTLYRRHYFSISVLPHLLFFYFFRFSFSQVISPPFVFSINLRPYSFCLLFILST